jgi:copper chaperone NosL
MNLGKATRVMLGAASLLLLITFYVPLWQIMLWAPQYPEGLTMKIWHNDLSGNIDIINGLNHYIGMKHIGVEMFPEFRYIGPLIGLLMIVGVAAAILGSGRILFLFTLMSYLYGVAALWDFWRWGYDYGHNLDPNAAIKVPDMSYQPPLIGYKNLLNFTSYSGPDTGAWIIIGVCMLATVLWWREFFINRKFKQKANARKMTGTVTLLVIAAGALSLAACSTGPEPIRYGQDNCHACKMTLTDKRFGAEIVTKKGRVYKFDDVNCLVGYIGEKGVAESEIAQTLVVDFARQGSFVAVEQAFFLQSEAIKSPMRADVAAFSDKQALEKTKADIPDGKEMDWNTLKASL